MRIRFYFTVAGSSDLTRFANLRAEDENVPDDDVRAGLPVFTGEECIQYSQRILIVLNTSGVPRTLNQLFS